MKTAEECWISNGLNPDYYTDSVEAAMEEYASQSMSAEQYSSGAIHSLGEFPTTKSMSAEQVEGFKNYLQRDVELSFLKQKDVDRIIWYLDTYFASTAQTVKEEGWVIPNDVTLKDIKAIRSYFGEHDKTLFEHRAFSIMNKLVDYFTPHPHRH